MKMASACQHRPASACTCEGDCLPLLIGKKLPVTTNYLVRLAPRPFVDHALVDTNRGTI
jgi:hypothetical protein